MKKVFFVLNKYGEPAQPYIARLIEAVKTKAEVGAIISVTKPVTPIKDVVFFKHSPGIFNYVWALAFYLTHQSFYKKGGFLFTVRSIANLRPILQEDEGIIHVIHSQKAPLIMSLCDPSKYDFVVHFRGYDTNVRPFEDEGWRKDLKNIYAKARALIFVSDALRDVAVTHFGAPIEKCHISAGGVMTTLQAANPGDGDICKFATIGRMAWEKGYPFTILAIKKLLEKTDKFEYHIIGGGEGLNEVNYLVRYFNLQKYVVVHGFVENAAAKEIVKDCSVYMQCSLSEASSLSLKEAGMMGLALIATNVGGNPDIVKEGVTGKLVEIGDIEGLADAMYQYMINPEMRATYGKNAQSLCVNEYSVDAESRRVLNIYKEINEKS